ncbi:MAG: Formate hydrogenlyase transcriptional activator [Deltaproteobacteria bacterium ADurb.Bin072]|nr:MAG: Formate hydrogenlyase transcriptional activator [Deltaproteobacteria bacterium ADurb.Bin072]
MDDLQRRYISHVLDLTGGRIGGPGGAAEVLGMKRTTLQARMKKLGIS